MKNGTLIFGLIFMMMMGYNFTGSAPVTEYVSMTAKLEQTGTGEFNKLILIDENDNRYLVQPPYEEKLKKLNGITLLVSGKLKRVEGTQFQGEFKVDAYNTIPIRELDHKQKVVVMGVLKEIEDEYYLLTYSQVILSLDLSSESLLTDYVDQEVLLRGDVSLDGKYNGRMDVISYRILTEKNTSR